MDPFETHLWIIPRGAWIPGWGPLLCKVRNGPVEFHVGRTGISVTHVIGKSWGKNLASVLVQFNYEWNGLADGSGLLSKSLHSILGY